MDPHKRYRRFGEEKRIFILPVIENRFFGRPARNLFSIPIGLL
jgi:hypothetical protein